MNPELKIIEDILKKNSDDANSIDIENEVEHYFIFDKITDPIDLEKVWSLFGENKEIRERLKNVESNTDIIPGWGYLVPEQEQICCDEQELKGLVDSHIKNLRPILLEEDYNNEIISFIDTGYTIELAPANIEIPNASDNELFGVLYEALSEYKLEHFPYEKAHYEVLNNWAIYLTKCDEVAVYLLWPCLQHSENPDPLLMEPGAKLWKLDCRDRYWVKDLDYSSKTIYVRPPWLD